MSGRYVYILPAGYRRYVYITPGQGAMRSARIRL